MKASFQKFEKEPWLFRPTLKQRIGCWIYEMWKTELVLRAPGFAALFGLHWLDLCNRNETLSKDPITNGRICNWSFTSKLTSARFYPRIGGKLLNQCLKLWPIQLSGGETFDTATPVVSVILGVRGTARLQQFKLCLESLRGQAGVPVEIIVVEQSERSEFHNLIPSGVRYFHQQIPNSNLPYNRSWALNTGANLARGRILLLHDADMLLPKASCAAIAEIIDRGLDAVRLPRFLFYLNEQTSRQVQLTKQIPNNLLIDDVVSNNRTPVAVTKSAYFKIGGHDESFFGWGGEDDEFMDRLRTLNIGEGAFLPIVHLWHPVAPNRLGDRNASHLAKTLNIPAPERIRLLTKVKMGQKTPNATWNRASALESNTV